MSDEELWPDGRVSRVEFSVLDGLHSFVEHISRDADSLAEFECVEVLNLPCCDHDVESRLIVDEPLSSAVVYVSPRREDDAPIVCVTVGFGLIVAADKLKRRQPPDVHGDNHQNDATDDKLSIFENGTFFHQLY